MQKRFSKKIAVLIVAGALVGAMTAGAASAAPVLRAGQTSAPGMSGRCTNCHAYAVKKKVKKHKKRARHAAVRTTAVR